jgi:hypothetical protein
MRKKLLELSVKVGKELEKVCDKLDLDDLQKDEIDEAVTAVFNKEISADSLDDFLFVDWLMENCELAEDNSLWSYNGEDYTNEKLFKIYINEIEAEAEKLTE